jgi:polysaccharide pyruvyl transferase WcaK-like protein
VNRYLDTWASANRESMGKEAFIEIFSKALEQVHAELKVPLVFVSTQYHDVELSEELASRLPSTIPTACIDNRVIGHEGTKGVLRHVDLLCGMRLHSLILASSEMTPIVGITYQPKVAYYFRELELSERTLSFDNFSIESLRDHILNGWQDREQLKTSLSNRIPVLQQRAAWSGKLVAGLAQSQDTFEKLWNQGPGI